MRKRFFAVLAGTFVFSLSCPGAGQAWMHYNNTNPHASVNQDSVQPEAVPVPGTNVYIAPDYDDDIVFYHDWWYRVRDGKWDMARDFNGPWKYVAEERVPDALLKLPTNFRHSADKHVKIPYSLLKSNWKAWEDDGRWEKHAVKELHRYYKDVIYDNSGQGRADN
jgi:hypothetical protein